MALDFKETSADVAVLPRHRGAFSLRKVRVKRIMRVNSPWAPGNAQMLHGKHGKPPLRGLFNRTMVMEETG